RRQRPRQRELRGREARRRQRERGQALHRERRGAGAGDRGRLVDREGEVLRRVGADAVVRRERDRVVAAGARGGGAAELAGARVEVDAGRQRAALAERGHWVAGGLHGERAGAARGEGGRVAGGDRSRFVNGEGEVLRRV